MLISYKKSINKLLKQNSKYDLQGEITFKYSCKYSMLNVWRIRRLIFI